MVVAPLDPNRVGGLRELLASMNDRPGVVNPHNSVFSFGRFDRLHFARFVILDDQTVDDVTAHRVPRPDLPVYLAFLGDCDGSARDFMAELVQRAGDGLRRLFAHCQGFVSGCDLLQWMRDHDQSAAASYVNWLGRTVRQIREENALRNALESYLDSEARALVGKEPKQIRNKLREFVNAEVKAGRLALTAPEPTPGSWRLRDLRDCIGVPFILLLFAPFLILYLPFFVLQLRRRECHDPEIAPRPDPDHVQKLADLEDHNITNQFNAIGSVKPGLFRRWTLTFILWVLNYTTRHIYIRGHLARVSTIHFARWVFLDDKRRMLFASNYDGSLESYMDDFINKVAWGLNLVFSNGVGYPRTNWLILDGAKNEQKFNYYIRRHQLPTEVWYNSHPGLSAFDLERNARIREGIEKNFMTDIEIQDWIKLF
jgi:hypothetical protein